MDIEIGWASKEDWSVFSDWRKLDTIVNDFAYIWHRNGLWEETSPVVARVDGKIVGFHAVTFLKNDYINSQFQFVLKEFRGMGLAGAMVDAFLHEGTEVGSKRLRFRCPKEGNGDAFWRGFGLFPLGSTRSEYFFDLCIWGVGDIATLIRNAKELCGIPPVDKRMISYYKRIGVL